MRRPPHPRYPRDPHHPCRSAAAPRAALHGFTLIELLVAIAVMALMAVLSWRGLDGMTRAQAHTQQRADDVLALQAGLDQWGADLDTLVQWPPLDHAIDWDGRVLRLIRRSTAAPYDGAQVVAWTLRAGAHGNWWLRWQSPLLRTRGELQQAWEQAALWAHEPGDDAQTNTPNTREVAVVQLDQWQIFYFRGDAWSRPLSSERTADPPTAAPAAGPPSTPSSAAALPEGVRLVLTLPVGHALSGTLTRDWVRPTVGKGPS